MTEDEIEHRFIQAARTDRARNVNWRPQSYGSTMPAYVHTHVDKAGWRKEHGDKLLPEDWDAEKRRNANSDRPVVTAADISDLDECERWAIEMVGDERQRRALWNWAQSKAGGRSFKVWCNEEGIATETGRRRKDRAVAQIAHAFACKLLQNNEMSALGVLLEDRLQPYLQPTFGSGAQDTARPSWKTNPDLRPLHDPDAADFSWAEKRNERRRQMRARAEREKDQAA